MSVGISFSRNLISLRQLKPMFKKTKKAEAYAGISMETKHMTKAEASSEKVSRMDAMTRSISNHPQIYNVIHNECYFVYNIPLCLDQKGLFKNIFKRNSQMKTDSDLLLDEFLRKIEDKLNEKLSKEKISLSRTGNCLPGGLGASLKSRQVKRTDDAQKEKATAAVQSVIPKALILLEEGVDDAPNGGIDKLGFMIDERKLALQNDAKEKTRHLEDKETLRGKVTRTMGVLGRLR